MNDPSDTAAGATGTTWVYAYDRGGNILSKKKYALTDAATSALANQTPLQTISYGYDTTWKDKLTSYNGVSITYDAIGNPLSDGAWAYTWEKGRQLKRMVKGVEDTAGYESLDYAYNAEGLRIRKTHTVYDADAEANVITTTEYTLHGKNVVQLTRTRGVFDGDGAPVPNTDTASDSCHFRFDAQNKPAVVEWSATDADNVTTTAKYAYIHNLQGDIVGIRDVNGTEVVRYTYDAWGKLLATTGSLASTLGCLNPFRYRGYVYDEETGLYYLRSRYYNPTWGRFISIDDVIGVVGERLSHNLFIYCKNKPICRIDSNGHRDINAIEEYIDKWYQTDGFNYNYDYYNYRNDCANYASQILAAGGMTQTDEWHSIKKGKKTDWISQLKSLINYKHGYNWDVSKAWQTVGDLYGYFSQEKYCKSITILDEHNVMNTTYSSNEFLVGDLVFFDDDGDGNPNHAGAVSGIVNGMLCYTGHTKSRYKEEVSNYLSGNGNAKIYVLHLEYQ